MAENSLLPPGYTQALTSYTVTHTVADMSPLVAQAIATRAEADVKVAEATHAVPARQETVRAGIAYGSVLTIAAISCLALDGALRGWVLIGCAVALGGAAGISQIIKALKQSKGATS
jgi:hypothetical protein